MDGGLLSKGTNDDTNGTDAKDGSNLLVPGLEQDNLFEDSFLNECCFCKDGDGRIEEHPHSTTATTMLRNMIEGNRDFLKSRRDGYYESIKSHQTPVATLLTCSDSRIHFNIFSFDPINQLFIIRNIGNQVAVNAGSVEYGIRCLNTRILMVMGHTHCGAIKAALTGFGIDSPEILSELIHLPIDKTVETEDKVEFERLWDEAVELNVDYQVDVVMKRYHKEVKEGRLYIVGAIKDILNVYGVEAGRFIITNVNGVKNVESIKKSHLMKEVSGPLKDICIRRITQG